MTSSRAAKLPQQLSLYLDLLRFGAATVVLLTHACPVLFPSLKLPWPGHSAVVVFFVLSGFVIAHATNRADLRPAEYANHRAARILSVTIPALILSGFVTAMVADRPLDPFEDMIGGPVERATQLLLSLLFLGQAWALDVFPPLNGPYWSLNYEVWYYVLFGIWCYGRGWARVLLLLVTALIVGPGVLLLLPIWVLGAVLYWHRPTFRPPIALLLFGASAVLAVLTVGSGIGLQARGVLWLHWPEAMRGLHGANQFVGDWILALLVALNIAAAGSLGRFGAPLEWLARPIRAAAGCTFSIYLYHYPLLVLAVLVLGLRSWVALAAVAVAIVLLARVTEHQVGAVRRLLRSISLRLVQA